MSGGRKPTLSEAKSLMRLWDRSTFETLAESIRKHARKHGFGSDVWYYLRRSAAFRKRGASRKHLPDGAVRYGKGREFLIERDGKIVTYGINREP